MTPTVLTPSSPRGILVPLDGSELAEQALSVAAARARKTGATLHLVSVHEPLPPLAMPPDVPLPTSELEQDARAERQQYLESLAGKVRELLPTPITATVLAGDAAAVLAEYVASHEVDLVVMTTHGRTGLSRLWLGSVADRMLRRVAIPVLLLHPSEAPQPTEFGHLVVALDGDIEQPVLDAMMILGARAGVTRCILTRVVEPTIPVLSGLALRPGHLSPDWTAKQVEDARRYLEGLGEPMAREGWDVDWEVVVGRGIAAQVLALAEAGAADCIVVGTHGARGVERLLLGSVADKIVRGAKVPVLVAPVGHIAGEPAHAGSEARAPRALEFSSSLLTA
jgi:nucleotide-binding universal stress UspA family protein